MFGAVGSFLSDLLLKFDTRSAEVALGLCLMSYGVGSAFDAVATDSGMVAWLLGAGTHVAAHSGRPPGRRVVNAVGFAFWVFEVVRNAGMIPARTMMMYASLALVSLLVSVRAVERRAERRNECPKSTE